MPLTISIFLVAFAALVVSGAALLFATRMRALSAVGSARSLDADRYRPMLRLLGDEDLKFAAGTPKLRAKLRKQRRELFRGYLQCLTKDYAAMLGQIRRMMVESSVDRPDLTRALAKNRLHFALALCRIEVRLQLHAWDLATVDVSPLVEALDGLRGAVSVMTPAVGMA